MNTINELIRDAATPAEAIEKLQQGRNQNFFDQHKVNEAIDPYQHKVMKPAYRPDKEVNVMNDEGKVVGTKSVPVDRIATDLQQLIVKRAVSFLFGNDVNLYVDSDESDEQADELLRSVKRVMVESKTRSLNRELARDVFTSTEAAEIWYFADAARHDRYGFPAEQKLRCMIVSPRNGNTLYPYFDEQGDMVAFSRSFTNSRTNKGYFETYTDTMHYLYTNENGDWALVEGYPQEHGFGKIPCVYSCQKYPEWHEVQPLIDRLETLLSNFADTNDYHASPKIFVTGDIRGWSQKGESGAVIEGGEGATAQYLSWAQAPESVKLEISTLLNLIYTLTQTPDISFDNVKGLNTSGVALKLLFMDAHLKVQDKSEIFIEHLQRRINVVLAMLASIAPADMAARLNDVIIEPEIVPYMIEDEASKINAIMAATGQKAIMSRKTGVEALNYVNDTNAELERIEAEGAAESMTNLLEPTM